MAARRSVVAYRVIAIFGVAIAIVASTRVLRIARGTDAVEGRRVAACSAARDLRFGETAPLDACAPIPVRQRSLPSDTVRRASDLANRVVVVPVVEGTVITERHLAPRARTGTDAIVPPGMRAVRVAPADGYTPAAGSIVDVVAATAAEFDTRSSATVVARRASVATDPSPGRDPSVLLIVTPEQAQRIAAARVNGKLTLAVLPPEDGRPLGPST